MNELTNLAPIITGFLLTTVLGGLLGFFFQNRSWEHQHKIQQAEQERLHKMQMAEERRERALQIFDEISRLLDKRLYRLRLVYWSLLTDEGRVRHSLSAESRFEDYRHVLYEWNDSINRNLALLQHYLGSRMRNRLDYEVGASFVELGRIIEKWWKNGVTPEPDQPVDSRLEKLSNLVYMFNLDMIRAIQSDDFGEASLRVTEPLSNVLITGDCLSPRPSEKHRPRHNFMEVGCDPRRQIHLICAPRRVIVERRQPHRTAD